MLWIAAGLMVLCALGMGRPLWLLEGEPHLDRPSWLKRTPRDVQGDGVGTVSRVD